MTVIVTWVLLSIVVSPAIGAILGGPYPNGSSN